MRYVSILIYVLPKTSMIRQDTKDDLGGGSGGFPYITGSICCIYWAGKHPGQGLFGDTVVMHLRGKLSCIRIV